jgi:putative lipoprotein (rSAM/lipoprotein system)
MRVLYRCAAVVLGAILGFGCEHSVEPSEYGSPYATLRLDGHVTAASSGNPITNILVSLHHDSDVQSEVRSDAQGHWSMRVDHGPLCGATGSDACSLSVSDTDGHANGGKFAAASVPLDLVRTEHGHSWYEGTFEQHNIEIELTEE